MFTCQLALINLVFGEIAQCLEHLPAAVAAVQSGLFLVVVLLPLLLPPPGTGQITETDRQTARRQAWPLGRDSDWLAACGEPNRARPI